jgi:hypothetical protein
MKNLFLFTISLLCLWLCQVSWCAEKKASSPRAKLVRVYFLRQNKAKNGELLEPVWRRVSAKAPAQGVLQALLKGPTDHERKLGFWKLDSDDLQIGRLSIHRSVAYVDFVADRNQSWLGDMTPMHFRDAVKKCMLQFPRIKKVEVSVDGDKDFYIQM